ncbi:hypothetical protein BJ546DRAFT_426900 [Cryomyces antarcticus]|nr:hypothetical protein LTR60_000761 [Cryomyces antarcticus]
MPKELKEATPRRTSPVAAPQRPQSPPNVQTTWSSADDETLMAARARNMNWQPVALTYFPTKTANACRKRHERLMEKRRAEDWDSVKLEKLAKGYIECRREMWDVLASRVGERWQIVEQKCMEKGLKNLQAASRASQKRHARQLVIPNQDHEQDHNDPDSGIGDSDHETATDDGRPHQVFLPLPTQLTSQIILPLQSDVRNDGEAVQRRESVLMLQAPVSRPGPSIQSMLSPSLPADS